MFNNTHTDHFFLKVFIYHYLEHFITNIKVSFERQFTPKSMTTIVLGIFYWFGRYPCLEGTAQDRTAQHCIKSRELPGPFRKQSRCWGMRGPFHFKEAGTHPGVCVRQGWPVGLASLSSSPVSSTSATLHLHAFLKAVKMNPGKMGLHCVHVTN